MEKTDSFERLDPLGLEVAYLDPDRREAEAQEGHISPELLHDIPFAQGAGEAEQDEERPLGTDLEGFESETGTAHSFNGCSDTEKALLIDAANRALGALYHASNFIGSAYGRPKTMSKALKQLLERHFHTTGHKDLLFILRMLTRIVAAFNSGIRFQCQRNCKADAAGMVCGYAYTTQWFGGMGRVNVCFDPHPQHCNFASQSKDEQEAIIIHEVAHRYAGIDDKAYSHEAKYANLKPSDALDNADSYAFFCVEGKSALVRGAHEAEEFDRDFEDRFSQSEWGEAPTGLTFPSGLVLPLASGRTGKHEEHWDPNGTGLPLLDVEASLNQKISPHFTVAELVSSGGRTASIARISPELVRVLELIRVHCARPVKITSGYRSWQYNDELYRRRHKRTTLSRHCSGQAVDLKIAGLSGLNQAKLVVDACGPDLGIGLGHDFIHVDVRGTSTVWNYVGGSAGDAAVAALKRYIAGLRKPHPAVPTSSPPSPSSPSSSPRPATSPMSGAAGNRLVVEHHPLLASHHGKAPDLILKWNQLPPSGPIDVVVHFHGYGPPGLSLARDKEPISGLDFKDPKTGARGRTRSTLAILPRGSYVGDEPGRNPIAFAFPALTGPGDLDALIKDCLARVGASTGTNLAMGRLIITGHSGGGAPIRAILAHMDPDEVEILDGMYGPGDTIAKWAKSRIERELGSPSNPSPSLRVLYNPISQTGPHSEALWRMICPMLAPSAAARLRPYFRVERTAVEHNSIPPTFGWRLLADAGADLPSVVELSCGPSARASEAGESEWFADPATSTEWTEAGLSEAPAYWPSAGMEAPLEGGELPEAPGENQEEWFETEEEDRESGHSEEGEELAWLDYEGGWANQWTHAHGDGETDRDSSLGEGEAGAASYGRDGWSVASTGGADSRSGEISEAESWGEDEGDGGRAEMLGELLELEAGPGSGLADRIKGTAAFLLGPPLRRGQKGPEVEALQRCLVSVGENISVDGSFGPATDRAVRAFQSRSGLSPDGIVGSATKAALAAALARGGKASPVPPKPGPSPSPSPGPIPIPPAPSGDEDVDAFCERLARQWSDASRGKVDFETKRQQLRTDYDQTMEGAHKRFGAKKSEQSIRKGWMTSRQQQMLFDTQGSGWKPLGPFGPPTTKVDLVSDARIAGSDKAPVAPLTVRFLEALQRRNGRVSATTYRGHGGGAFLDRGYSLDLWLPKKDDRGFFDPEASIELMRDVDAAARAVGTRWRILYNDFTVADTINRELAARHMVFMGQPLVSKGRIAGLNWHGPDPLILHFHLDLAPLSGSEGEAFDSEEFGSEEEHLESPFGSEDEDRLEALEALFDSEDSTGASLVERLKGVAEFLLGSTLKRGSSGAPVEALQRALTNLGTELTVDGNFGPATDRAVRAFQASAGLDADGVVGAATKAAIAAALGKRGLSPSPSPVPSPTPTPGPPPAGKKLTPKQFVATYAAAARASEATYAVPALVTLGQAALESGWGAHAPQFNFFGIKARASDPPGSRQLLQTREVLKSPTATFPDGPHTGTLRPDGKYDFIVKDWFRAYPSAEASFNDHGRVLTAKRYSKAFTVGGEPYAFATEVARGGYATDPSYASVLHGVMRTIEKTGML